MIKDTLIAGLIALIICVILCPICIPILHKMKFGQEIRDCGPEAHKKKSGTPTMGGIMIIIAIIVPSLLYVHKYSFIWPVLIFTLAFGVIGFLDDILKIHKHTSEGLKTIQKLVLQLIVTGIFALYIFKHPTIGTDMLIPFTGGMNDGMFLKLGVLFIPAVFFIVLGTDNGVNFTDGLDGLCSAVTIAVAGFFAVASIKEQIPAAPIAGAVVGALMGFAVFNVYPAKVFMGDTGSLALGGFVASYALISRMPLFIVVVGIIYLIEVVSVMMQVTYFKATHGKRIFRMTPIHHHFELGGWSETRVMAVFTVITIVAGVCAYIGLM